MAGSPVTRTGDSRSVYEPSPICPQSLLPHVHTEPSASSARTWYAPTAMSRTPVKDGTSVGDEWGVVVPSPSWPSTLPPHVHTRPAGLSTAAECAAPAATFVMPENPVG